MKGLYRKLRKYIGSVEMVVIIIGLLALTLYLDKKERQDIHEQLLTELKAYTEENARIAAEMEKSMNASQLRVMDSIYAPFVIDSLCQYTDSARTKGFITLSKFAPGYEKLCSTKENYYMWVGLERLFPLPGQLIQVTGVAQNDEIIQFHFKISNNEETLDDMLMRLDSTLQQIKGVKLQ